MELTHPNSYKETNVIEYGVGASAWLNAHHAEPYVLGDQRFTLALVAWGQVLLADTAHAIGGA